MGLLMCPTENEADDQITDRYGSEEGAGEPPASQPQLSRPRGASPIATAAARMLATILIYHAEGDLIAQAIDFVRRRGALLAQSSTSQLDESTKRDVLVVDCTPLQWTRIERELRKSFKQATVETSQFGLVSPATIVANIHDYQAVSSELTRSLAGLGCDILLSNTVKLPESNDSGPSCVFNAIVTRPPNVLPWRLYESLTPIIRERGGKVLVVEGCCELLDEQETRQALISPVFRGHSGPLPLAESVRVAPRGPVTLARAVLQMGCSQPGVMASVLQILRLLRARILFPQGIVTSFGAGIVDVLFEAETDSLTAIQQAIACCFPEMQLSLAPLNGSGLGGLIITARKHDGLTLATVRLLAAYGLQIVQISGAHSLSEFDIRQRAGVHADRTIAAIVRLTDANAFTEFTRALNRLANEREGRAIACNNYCELFGVSLESGRSISLEE